MAQAILRSTHLETVIKVSGPSGTSEVIDISTLLAVGQELIPAGTPKANIVGVTWTGHPNAVITVTRNVLVGETPTATRVLTLPCTGANSIDFGGQELPPESTGNDSDLTVAVTAEAGEVYIKLRKVDGFRTQIEDATYGHYDDPTRVGASTTKIGSPDYSA
jgi:hypothetical protein